MSAFKGTPGPWRLVRSVKTWQMPLQIEAADGLCIVALDAHPLHDMDANARLIAAAPELLEAAIELRQRQRDYLADPKGDRQEAKGRLVGEAAAKLDAAIGKATGTDEPIPGSDDLESEE